MPDAKIFVDLSAESNGLLKNIPVRNVEKNVPVLLMQGCAKFEPPCNWLAE